MRDLSTHKTIFTSDKTFQGEGIKSENRVYSPIYQIQEQVLVKKKIELTLLFIIYRYRYW